MRIAVISDIHGNDIAFEASLADIRRDLPDQIVWLGDSLFFNPGSIGLVVDNRPDRAGPQRADPWAEYALLSYDSGRLAIEFRRVPYDAQRWIDVLRGSGRPDADVHIALYTK